LAILYGEASSMKWICGVAVLLGLLGSMATADEPAVAQQYASLLDEYERTGGARAFAKRFLELAEGHPDDVAAADALLWVVGNVRGRSETTRALQLLAQHHATSDKLVTALPAIAEARSTAAEPLLRTVADSSPDPTTRALATYHLARLLDTEANLVDQLQAQPERAAQVLQYYGKEYGQYLAELDPAALGNRREQAYQWLLAEASDVPLQESTLGKIAERRLFAIRHLSVGRVAPEIDGEDINGQRFKLSDFRGKVVMLTFWGHW
jgi:hypothetical protein